MVNCYKSGSLAGKVLLVICTAVFLLGQPQVSPGEMTIYRPADMPGPATSEWYNWTGEKPQSKVWSYDTTWWCVLPSTDGTWLWRLNRDTLSWAKVLLLSSKMCVNADCKQIEDVTHIILYDYSNTSEGNLISVKYAAGTPGTYQLWDMRPGTITVPLSSRTETVTIDVDSHDRMWVAYDVSTTIEIRYSDSPYSSWSPPITMARGINPDDICVITAMPNNMVGLFWSDQERWQFGFRVHNDGNDPTVWSADETPALSSGLREGAGMADDHMNIAVASDGTLYVAIKTSYTDAGGSGPQIAMLVRRPGGIWDDLYEVDITGTRPSVALNEEAGKVMMMYTATYAPLGYGAVVYKETSVSAIDFSGNTSLLIAPGLYHNINNISGTKKNFSHELVLIAGSWKEGAYGLGHSAFISCPDLKDCMTDSDALAFTTGVNATTGHRPYPIDGASAIDTDVNLSWSPGLSADDVKGYIVYLGTDKTAVANANESNHLGVYKGSDAVLGPDSAGRFSYNPNLPEIGDTYYWRIDEVHDPNISPGELWSFGVELHFAVTPTVETDPVQTPQDAADDVCIWLHPTDPTQSTIIGTDKGYGLFVYGLNGTVIQSLPDGGMNNVDIRYNFPLDGKAVALVTAGNRSNDSIAIYRVDPSTRQLQNVAARAITTGIKVYGSCMGRSLVTGKYYFYVNSKQGSVEQWELFDNGSGKVDARKVRSFEVGSLTEGCVVDDELGYFYIGEEYVAIWKYGAEPSDGATRTKVDSTGAQGHLETDVEGLCIYYANDGTGYLIGSSQHADEFVIYRREGNNDYVGTFEVVSGNGIDGLRDTDGIDVANSCFGPGFPKGFFIAQDGTNTGGNQNYKLVPWEAIAEGPTPPLTIDTSWSPR